MKKLQIFALAALVAVGLSSCMKNITDGPETTDGQYQLVIKMGGGSGNTRAEEAPYNAATDKIEVKNGQIFIFNATGTKILSEAIDVTNAVVVNGTEPGQVISKLVDATDRVFVVANAPSSFDPANILTLTDIRNFYANINTQADFKTVTLANVSGSAAAINPVNSGGTATFPNALGTATCNVQIAPVVARLELGKIQAYLKDTGAPASYTVTQKISVTGIWLNNYYPQFTMSGGFYGTKIVRKAPLASGDNELTSAITMPASDQTGVYKPAGAGNVWAWQVPAGGNTTTLLVELTHTTDAEPVKYVIVTGYGENFAGFQPGKIYRIGEISFNADDWANLSDTPDLNQGYELNVTIEVVEWEVENIEPTYQ